MFIKIRLRGYPTVDSGHWDDERVYNFSRDVDDNIVFLC